MPSRRLYPLAALVLAAVPAAAFAAATPATNVLYRATVEQPQPTALSGTIRFKVRKAPDTKPPAHRLSDLSIQLELRCETSNATSSDAYAAALSTGPRVDAQTASFVFRNAKKGLTVSGRFVSAGTAKGTVRWAKEHCTAVAPFVAKAAPR
jgi:hypothetical protein